MFHLGQQPSIISSISKEVENCPDFAETGGEEENLENTEPSEQQKSKLTPKYLVTLVG